MLFHQYNALNLIWDDFTLCYGIIGVELVIELGAVVDVDEAASQ